jgi:hypothetical protein
MLINASKQTALKIGLFFRIFACDILLRQRVKPDNQLHHQVGQEVHSALATSGAAFAAFLLL